MSESRTLKVLVLLHCFVATGFSGEVACGNSARLAASSHGQYCICDHDAVCHGSECKHGSLDGRQVSGFDAQCETCLCSGRSELRTTARTPRPRQRQQLNASANTSEGDNHQIIFIKSFKVASTTISAVFSRIAQEKQLKVANRYNAVELGSEQTYNIIFGHNFYDYGTSLLGPSAGCTVQLRDDNTWTYCGGYQPWMDEYVPNAHHLVMVAEPYERVASMYYYEAAYTKLRDRWPGDTEYKRMNNASRFQNPTGEDRKFIQRWLSNNYTYKWERVQWWWLREGTPHRTLNETIDMLKTKFMVGLTSRLDETLLLWRRQLNLEIRDIIYTSVKAQLSHPRLSDWHPDEQNQARALVTATQDDVYFEAASARFQHQIEAYGAELLQRDLSKFRSLLERLRAICNTSYVTSEVLHVPDQVHCMLKHYDQLFEQQVTIADEVGCYTALTTPSGFASRYSLKLHDTGLTATRCWRLCKQKGFAYAATSSGIQCFCGSELPRPEFHTNSECAANCDPLQYDCGTAGFVVYKEAANDYRKIIPTWPT